MYCHNCGKQIPLHSPACLYCGSTIAIQQAVPLQKTRRKMGTIISVTALALTCIVALLFAFSSDTGQRDPAALTTASNLTGTPSGTSIPQEATPTSERHSKTPGKTDVSARSKSNSSSARVDSTVRSVPAAKAESADSVRSFTPKQKQVEATFYITRTGARYHRDGCRFLRYSAFPITRSRAEAQGYTPCRVCYP
jgi:hypothetical protein